MFDTNHNQYRRPELAPSLEPLELRRMRELTAAYNGVMSLNYLGVEVESSQPAMPIENRPNEQIASVTDLAARRSQTPPNNTYPGQNYEGQQAA